MPDRTAANAMRAAETSRRPARSRSSPPQCTSQPKLRSTCADRDPVGGGAKLGCDAGGWAARSYLGEDAMAHYAAFDVSDKETAIHVLDEHGKLGSVGIHRELMTAAARRIMAAKL